MSSLRRSPRHICRVEPTPVLSVCCYPCMSCVPLFSPRCPVNLHAVAPDIRQLDTGTHDQPALHVALLVVSTRQQRRARTPRTRTPATTTTSQALPRHLTLNPILTTTKATRTSSHHLNPAPKYRQGLCLLPFRMGPSRTALAAVSRTRRCLVWRPLHVAGSLRKCHSVPRVLQLFPLQTPQNGSRLPTMRPSIRTCQNLSTLPTASGPTTATAQKPSSLATPSTLFRYTNGTRIPR